MKMNDFLYKLGQAIRKYRIASGCSQEELSARIDCDKNTIGKIERGESDFRISTLERLAQGMNTTCSRILKEIEQDNNDIFNDTINHDYLRLLSYCHQLSPEQFNNLCNTAHLYAKANHENH